LKKNKMLQLVMWIVSFEMIGYLLGIMTQNNIHPWYTSLLKSPLTPPGFIFSITWSFLYGLLAVIYWRLSRCRSLSLAMKIFLGLQMLMNWCWTPLFFQLHDLKLSAIWLCGLVCFNTFLILRLKKIDRTSALLWIPYWIWIVFASYLNIFIAWCN
jgi:translocator protein